MLAGLLAGLATGCGLETASRGGVEEEGGGPASSASVAASVTLQPPPDIPESWRPLIGEYAAGPDTVSLMEDGGELKYLRWGGERSAMRLEEDTLLVVTGMDTPVVIRWAREGAILGILSEGRVLSRLTLGGETGEGFRIDPVRPVVELRVEALAAEPPLEEGEFREADLVELTEVEPTIALDIRYATTNNFMGDQFYSSPRAFLQRPAAEALVRAHRWLGTLGYGLMIFDGYRPWYVTRMFWDATPPELRTFVANPTGGSRHNRGGAVDLTLYDLATGASVDMPGGYDEFSPRSFAAYPGGTMRQRWSRALLRLAMEAEGFAVYEAEWWHFDYKDWRFYRIGNQRFEELGMN
ncbi:MAG: M15 family metallopeptidase [Gemmatimonadota bacterium]